MPPKKEAETKVKKKKKKTKEELEEERRKAEEEARLAEEERRRLEEEERKRLEDLERERQRLLSNLLSIEDERVATERDELQAIFSQFQHERARAADVLLRERSWARFIQCTYVPHPDDKVAVNDFFSELKVASDEKVSDALQATQDCEQMAHDVMLARQEADQDGKIEDIQMHDTSLSTIHEIINIRLDRVTAHILQHSDEYANERGEIQLAVQHGSFQWGIWVNTSKNPRLRTVELPQINMVVEITKSIALNSICLRVQRRGLDEFYHRCSNELMAVSGVLYVDLLALPPAAKKVRGWTIRHVTHLSFNVQRIPYPIPPAGVDPLTYRAEEQPPPLGFSFPFPQDVCILGDGVKVAWWDAEISQWSTQGISDVSLDKSTSYLSFHTTHLGPLAVVQSRAALHPYRSWSIRPTGGKFGARAELTLEVGLQEPLIFEVSAGNVSLKSCGLPQIQGLIGQADTPPALLLLLSRHGIHLLPEERDAGAAGTKPKAREVESSFCQELALLGDTFLVASNKWNQRAEPDECLARINEVIDWEEGGRTELHHVQRIFSKEKEDGERRVIAVMARGSRGFAFSNALERRDQYMGLPGYATCESIQQEQASIWGEVHASLLSLLRGHQGDLKETLLAQRLQASPEALELVKNTNPIFSKTLGDLMFCMRLFSFG